MSTTLTEDQIESWRKMLVFHYGPIALLWSKEDIQAEHDRVQVEIDREDENARKEFYERD